MPLSTHVLKLVRLREEGVLSKGDIVSTTRYGECEVTYIRDGHSIVAKQTSSGRYVQFNGMFAGCDVQVRDRQVVTA